MSEKLMPTAPRPGKRGFCRECEWWGPKITHTGPDAYGVKSKWTEYPERCNHKDARESFCPKEMSDE